MIQRQPACFVFVSFHDTTTAFVLRTFGCLQLLELSRLRRCVLGLLRLTRPHPAAFVQARAAFLGFVRLVSFHAPTHVYHTQHHKDMTLQYACEDVEVEVECGGDDVGEVRDEHVVDAHDDRAGQDVAHKTEAQ